jgi:hypothetical protein
MHGGELPERSEWAYTPPIVRGAIGVALMLSLLPLTVTAPARAEIYRWVDATGVVHLDDTLANVPEAQRPDAKVFQSKARVAPASAPSTGPTQSAFANGVARELGLIAVETQDAVSALHIVGVYPSAGWNPTATLTSAVVEEVTRAARAAARARRLPQGEAAVEGAVLRVASGLGVDGPPPTVVVTAPEPEPPPLIVAPNIVIETPPTNVVVQTINPQPDPVLTRYGIDPFGEALLFAPIPSRPNPGPPPDRITPLSNPAGHLRGPAVPPRPHPGPFRRPPTF